MSDTITLNVYKYIVDFYNENKYIPMHEDILNDLKITGYALKKSLKILLADKKIERNGAHYYLPGKENIIPVTMARKNNEQAISEEVRKTAAKDTKSKQKDYSIVIVKFLFLTVGIISCCMSIHYTMLFFNEIESTVKSFFISFSMVVFTVVALEAIILFKSRLISIVFSVLWFSAIIFSMFCTVAGLYNRQMKIVESSNNFYVLEEYERQISFYDKELEDRQIERKRYLKLLSEYDTSKKEEENKYTVNKYRNIKSMLDKQIDGLQHSKNAVINKKVEILKSGEEIKKEEDNNIYFLISELIGVKVNNVKLIVYIIPALFFDIISSLSCAIILLKTKQE